MIESIEQRVAVLEGEPWYAAYLRVRGEVVRMMHADEGGSAEHEAPSAYWREELANFEYMLDASPLIVEKLRHHTYHVTGLRVYDYRTGKSGPRQSLARKLSALLDIGDRHLLVPEARSLGGFGFEIEGELYNLDTLKFFEALLALRRAEVLPRLGGTERPGVVEIGGGWGGFAYQVKKLFPNVRYTIVDFPELFLFSAVYLMALFPDARVAFAPGPDDAKAVEDADFVFVPHTRYRSAPLGTVDLAINMVSFQEMTSEQVAAYVDWAHELGTPYLYSLNRDRSLYNDELTSVRELIAERFWLREMYVLPMGYNEPMSVKRRRPRPRLGVDDPAADGNDRYRHVVGARKLLL
jgi:hypothetical protein